MSSATSSLRSRHTVLDVYLAVVGLHMLKLSTFADETVVFQQQCSVNDSSFTSLYNPSSIEALKTPSCFTPRMPFWTWAGVLIPPTDALKQDKQNKTDEQSAAETG